MKKNRYLRDFLLISISVFSLSIISLAFEWFLPKIDTRVDSLLYGVTIRHSVFLYIAVVISFFLYGWHLRRWFIKNNFETGDKSFNHLILVLLPIFLVGLVYSVIISFLNLPELHMFVRFSSLFLEVLQFVAVSAILGVFFYSSIERRMSNLFNKEILEVKDNELGISLFPKQIKQNSRKFGVFLSISIASVFILINMILLIIYPSVKAVTIEADLDFFYPNFWFQFDPADGLAQEYFKRTSIPSNIVFDWKLAQAILSVVLICLIISVLIIRGEEKEIKKKTESTKLTKEVEEENQEEIALRLFNPNTKNNEYVPSKFIETTTSRKYLQFFSRVNQSSFLPAMKLIVIGIFAILFSVTILQNTNALGKISQINDEYSNYIRFTQVIWEGFGEEIMFRLILFGLPLFVIYGALYSINRIYDIRLKNKSQNKEKSIFERYFIKEKLQNPLYFLSGGWKRLDILSVILLMFSSISFAYVQAPYGWNPWKMIYASILGLVCGYAYCKYGLHTAILINISTSLLMNWIFVSNHGIILNSPFLVFICLIIGSIILLILFSLALSKLFKLGSKLFN